MKYVYIAFCDEIILFSDIFRTLFGQTDGQTDRQTDIVVYREVTLPKTQNQNRNKMYFIGSMHILLTLEEEEENQKIKTTNMYSLIFAKANLQPLFSQIIQFQSTYGTQTSLEKSQHNQELLLLFRQSVKITFRLYTCQENNQSCRFQL